MKFKWIYLFLALLLPIGLSLFLKFFGKSQFDIPVYFANGVDSLKGTCAVKEEKPYRVNQSYFDRVTGKPLLITTDSTAEMDKNMARVAEEVGAESYRYMHIQNNVQNDTTINCVLFLRDPWTTVLVDDQGRIRGYYNPVTREEADRLIVEMKILLKQY